MSGDGGEVERGHERQCYEDFDDHDDGGRWRVRNEVMWRARLQGYQPTGISSPQVGLQNGETTVEIRSIDEEHRWSHTSEYIMI